MNIHIFTTSIHFSITIRKSKEIFLQFFHSAISDFMFYVDALAEKLKLYLKLPLPSLTSLCLADFSQFLGFLGRRHVIYFCGHCALASKAQKPQSYNSLSFYFTTHTYTHLGDTENGGER